MALRFRKTIKIAPGIRLNISKTGISTSIGPKGATVNMRGGKRKLTTGIPGTGLSQQHNLSDSGNSRGSTGLVWVAIIFMVIIGWVIS